MSTPGDAGDLALLSLLLRRVAHDLASPLGALVAALDLAGDPEPLAAAAARSLAARLSLWRALAGALPDDPFDWPAASAGLLAEAELGPGRALALEPIADVPPRAGRVAALLALQGLGLLGGRGLVSLRRDGDRLLVRIEGRLAPGAERLRDMLAGGGIAESHWAPLALARAMGLPMRAEEADGALLFSIPVPAAR